MTRHTLPFAVLATAALLHGAPTHAAALTKVWVANNGVDSATCGAISTPCATFQRAHDNVAAGGEIGVLTPGDYAGSGATRLTITKSVSITNDGVGEASVLVGSGVTGIRVSAATGDIVSLRGLVIDGQGVGQTGIDFETGAALHIQNCVIRNFEESPGGFGIFFPAVGGNQQLFVSDSIIFNNGSSVGGGIVVSSTSGTASGRVVLDRVHLENNIDGLLVDSHFTTGPGYQVIVRDSVISGNAGRGIRAISNTAGGKAPAFLMIERSSMVNNNNAGLQTFGTGATALLSDSTVARNGIGIDASNGGQIISYGNNRINNNIGPDGTPTGFDALN